MKKNIFKKTTILILIIILFSFFTPVHLVFSEDYNFLAPLPCENGTPGCVDKGLATFDPTGEGGGALGSYLNLMIKLFIGICAVLSVIMIVIGGIEYMTTELISGKEAGKERIWQAILGLLLALGAWTLLYTINPDLLNSDLKTLKNVTVEVSLNDNIPQTAVNGKYANGAIFGTVLNDTIGTIAILPAGVTINTRQCAKIGDTGCTSTRGLNLSYINTIKSKCSACSNLVITGGTEFWLHGGTTGSTSHQVDSPSVDLRTEPNLTNYITGGQTPVIMKRYQKDGISYLYEGSHWHVGA